MLEKIKSVYKLTRFDHAILIMIAVLIGETLTLGKLPALDWKFIVSLCAPAFVEMGAFALNDYLDRESDRINKRYDRPLVTGEISEETAVRVTFVSFFLAITVAALLPDPAMWTVWLFAFFSLLYDVKLKDIPLCGNIFIGTSMGIPFIFGNLVYTDRILQVNVILFVIALTIGVAREITKSIEDMEGDVKARGSKTLPVIIGKEKSILTVKLLTFVFVPLSVYPFLTVMKIGILSGIMLATAETLIIFGTVRLRPDKKSLKQYRKLSLIGMLTGVIAMLLTLVNL